MMESTSVQLLPPLSDLTDQQIAEAARAVGEPGWMIARREEAWRFFGEQVPPIWRRTDLTGFHAEELAAPMVPLGTQVQAIPAGDDQGVIFTTLAAALREHPDLVRAYFSTVVDPLAHKFTALHAALWQDGVFVYVPKDTVVELPLHVTLTLAAGTQAVFPHMLVVVERGAQVTFVEEYRSEAVEGQALCGAVTELVVGDGATLRFVTAQMWGSGVYTLGTQCARVGRDARIEWVSVSVGGQTQHIEATATLEGTGAQIEWVGMTFAHQHQSLLTAPTIRHVGTHTESHMNFHTVVDQQGYSTFDGMVRIERSGQRTNSRLEEHALHLSSESRSDSIPGLQIDANDVKAGHASTSGQIDEEQLFYMLSRGIRRDEAIHMIVVGFFEPVIERIPVEVLRDRISAAIEAKIAL